MSLSLSLLSPLMLYDALSWVLSVEPPAPSAVSLSFTVCISISSEDHFYPHSLYIAVPATSLPLQLFTLSSPFFYLLSLSLSSPRPLGAFFCALRLRCPHSTLSLTFLQSEALSLCTRVFFLNNVAFSMCKLRFTSLKTDL